MVEIGEKENILKLRWLRKEKCRNEMVEKGEKEKHIENEMSEKGEKGKIQKMRWLRQVRKKIY